MPSRGPAGWCWWRAFWAGVVLARGSSGSRGVVPDLGGRPQFPHPGLELLVQLRRRQALAQRLRHGLDRGRVLETGVLRVVGATQLLVGDAHLRPETELDVLQDGRLAASEP